MGRSKIKVVCWKWKPEKEVFRYREEYTAKHINNFARMVDAHLSIPFEIVCITDDPQGIDGGVRIVPLWDDLKEYGMCFRRLKSFSHDMQDLIGPKFVSMDIDCLIMKDFSDIINNNNDFQIWHPATKSRHSVYCGSMFMMKTGSRSFIWKEFNTEDLFWVEDKGGWVPGKSNRWAHKPAYEKGFKVGSDQAYLSYKLWPKEKVWTQSDGIYNFNADFYGRHKTGCEGLNKAKIMFFPGKFDPSQEELYENYPWIEKAWNINQ